MTSVEPAAVIDVPGSSGTIAVVTDGTTVWAAGDGAILRIDAATNKVERLPAPTQSDDTTMAFADDGLWVTRWAGHHLYRLDPKTGKVLLSVDLPTPVKIAFVGDDLWVGLENAHKMTLVDRKTGVLGRSVDAGAYGTSGLGDLWFASDHSTTIERVDPASGSVKATIEGKGEDNCNITGEFPDNVWLSCFGRDVRSRSATRIDPATNTVAAVATVPPSHGGSVAIIDGEPGSSACSMTPAETRSEGSFGWIPPPARSSGSSRSVLPIPTRLSLPQGRSGSPMRPVIAFSG